MSERISEYTFKTLLALVNLLINPCKNIQNTGIQAKERDPLYNSWRPKGKKGEVRRKIRKERYLS